METVYKTTLQSQMFIVKSLTIAGAYHFGVCLLLVQIYPKYSFDCAVIFVIGFFVGNILPSLILHIQYLRFSKGMELRTYSSREKIDISYQGKIHSIYLRDRPKIKIMLGSALFRGGRNGITVWESYHYATLDIGEPQPIVITCLLVNNLQRFFEQLGLSVQRERRIFPLIWEGKTTPQGG